MGARVVERADLAVRIADQEDLLVVNASGDELAGNVELAAMRGELPASIEDGLLLRLEDVGVDVVACGEGGGAIRFRVMRLLVEQAGDRGQLHASHLLTLSERYRKLPCGASGEYVQVSTSSSAPAHSRASRHPRASISASTKRLVLT